VSKYLLVLEQLQDKERVWVLFTHVCTWMGVDEQLCFLNHLDKVVRQLDAYQAPGAALYLHSLNGRTQD
jgi:hypothetical protein